MVLAPGRRPRGPGGELAALEPGLAAGAVEGSGRDSGGLALEEASVVGDGAMTRGRGLEGGAMARWELSAAGAGPTRRASTVQVTGHACEGQRES